MQLVTFTSDGLGNSYSYDVEGKMRLTLAVWIVLKAALKRHTQHDGNLERSLERRRVLILLDSDDRLPCDADAIGEILLRHLSQGPEFPNLVANGRH
jgi:hypothetical protein